MADLSYALTKLTTRFKDDGTRVYVTLYIAETEAATFYVNYEGLSVLTLHLMGASRKMAEKMVKSGVAEKYNVKERPIHPLRVLSCQAGTDPNTGQTILSAQTEEGPLVDLAFAPETIQKLLEKLSDLPGARSGGFQGPKVH